MPAGPGPDGAVSRSASAGQGLLPARVGSSSPRSGQGPRRPRFQPICGTGSPPRRAPRLRGCPRGASRTPRGPRPCLRGRPLPNEPSPPSPGRESLRQLAPRRGSYRRRRMSPPAPGAGCRTGHGEVPPRVLAPPNRRTRPRFPRGIGRLPRSSRRSLKTGRAFPVGRGVRRAQRADATWRPKPRRGTRGTSPHRPGRPSVGFPDPPQPVAPPPASAGS